MCDLTNNEEEDDDEDDNKESYKRYEEDNETFDSTAQEFLDEEAEYENNPDRVIALEARKPTVV